MDISRYASRLTRKATVLPSGIPTPQVEAEVEVAPSHFDRPKTLNPDPFPRDLPQEPEDARLTGGTRSLSRRLLALNISGLSNIRNASDPGDVSPSRRKIRKAVLSRPGLVA